MSRIGELLLKNGIITEQQLNEALERQKKKDKRLGEILIELGYLSSKDLLWMLSEQADIPFVEIEPEMLDNQLINRFPRNVLQKNSILPLYETEDKIYIAVGDPTDASAIQKIEKFTNKKAIASGADPKKTQELLNRFFSIQQVEEIRKVERKGRTTIRISDDKAIIEFSDESGKVTREKSCVKVIMSIGKEEGEKRNE